MPTDDYDPKANLLWTVLLNGITRAAFERCDDAVDYGRRAIAAEECDAFTIKLWSAV